MNIAGIELRYLADSLDKKTGGYYASNIYGVSRQSLLFKLHHPERPNLMLMFSTMGLWESSVRIAQIEPNRLLSRLRRELLRLRVTGIGQPGTERMAYARFGGFGRKRVLVGEFFGDGNIVLCDEDMRILALLHSLEVRHRRLAVGLEYVPPPPNSIDALAVTGKQLAAAGLGGLSADRWLGRTLGLPARYVGRMLSAAGVDPSAAASGLTGGDLDAVAASVRSVAGDVAEGRHEPAVVSSGAGAEVHPVRLSADAADETRAEAAAAAGCDGGGGSAGGAGGQTPGRAPIATFEEGLDRLFTEQILEAGRAGQSSGSDRRSRELQAQIDDQAAAAAAVREKASKISALAGSLAAAAAASLSDPAAARILAEHGAEQASDRGSPVVVIAGVRIAADPGAPLRSTASRLYDEAKRQAAAAPRIDALRKKAGRRLAELREQTDAERRSVTYSEVRKRAWYERYRWFFTTDGLLAVGGRDSSSNSSIIRRHLEPGDAVFHAEVHGSPFFVLKGALASPEGGRKRPSAAGTQAGLAEAAHATVCFSRAWREAMYGMSAYWVSPGQVKKSAPTGQYLPRGSFTIEGRRSFVRVPALRLAVGLAAPGAGRGGPALACGPPQAVRAGCALCAVIEPGGSAASDVAKRIRGEFSRMGGGNSSGVGGGGTSSGDASSLPLDEYVRVLPAGGSRIARFERGDSTSSGGHDGGGDAGR